MMSYQLTKKGLTLVEMMLVIVATSILLLGLTGILAQSQTAFNQTQTQLFGDVAKDSYTVQRIFDHFVRRSTQTYCEVDSDNLIVFYYSDPTVSLPDRYAWFDWSGIVGDSLMLTTGDLSIPGTYTGREAGNTRVIANNVTNCQFVQYGAALRMYLTLDDGQYDVSISTNATRHN